MFLSIIVVEGWLDGVWSGGIRQPSSTPFLLHPSTFLHTGRNRDERSGKETLSELDALLVGLLTAEPPWKLIFDRLGDYFNERFGKGWQNRRADFWSEFSRTYQVGRGIQQRLLHDRKACDKGI